jgi:hypothetical protein
VEVLWDWWSAKMISFNFIHCVQPAEAKFEDKEWKMMWVSVVGENKSKTWRHLYLADGGMLRCEALLKYWMRGRHGNKHNQCKRPRLNQE